MRLPAMIPLMSEADYNAIDAVRSSHLKEILRSPQHYQYLLASPTEPTPAMALGSAIHAAILEPKRFKEQFVISPKFDRRTNAGKAAAAEFESANAGKTLIDEERYKTIEGCLNAVYSHEIANRELSIGHAECAYVWKDEQTERVCKVKPDFMRPEAGVLIDVKTTLDCSPRSFSRTSVRFGYFVSAAFYLDGVSAVTGFQYKKFRIVAVETAPPYAVTVYEVDESSIEYGRALYRRALNTLAECSDLGVWPSYAIDVQNLALPTWVHHVEGEWE